MRCECAPECHQQDQVAHDDDQDPAWRAQREMTRPPPRARFLGISHLQGGEGAYFEAGILTHTPPFCGGKDSPIWQKRMYLLLQVFFSLRRQKTWSLARMKTGIVQRLDVTKYQ